MGGIPDWLLEATAWSLQPWCPAVSRAIRIRWWVGAEWNSTISQAVYPFVVYIRIGSYEVQQNCHCSHAPEHSTPEILRVGYRINLARQTHCRQQLYREEQHWPLHRRL